jgi:lipoate-protein ligase A
MLGRLLLWMDASARTGPEAMAVDEWLWETASEPVLRIYQWQGAWGSIGCFGRLAEARAALPGLDWVRRWTGGGTVDHRYDWTYTLVLPASENLARAKGAESYRIIHAALARALALEGHPARLADAAATAAGGLCFQQPVEYDLLEKHGIKLAGAGQRRTRSGLLHQGSVAAATADTASSLHRARRLAAALAVGCEEISLNPPAEDLRERIARRYGNPEWTQRR